MSGLSEAEREALAGSLRWHFNCHAAEPEKSYASLGIENAILHVEAILAAHDAERDVLAARVEAGLALLADEPMFVSGIRRAIDRNTDGYGRGGDITHTPRPGHRGSGSCPGDNLTGWLDRLTAALASPDPREHGTGGGDE